MSRVLPVATEVAAVAADRVRSEMLTNITNISSITDMLALAHY